MNKEWSGHKKLQQLEGAHGLHHTWLPSYTQIFVNAGTALRATLYLSVTFVDWSLVTFLKAPLCTFMYSRLGSHVLLRTLIN
jgi:hypothetical protein